jgi:hypothetical protein
MVDSNTIAIKLGIELTAVVRNENISSPTFVQRSVNDVVNVRPGESVVLISVTQHEGLLPASTKSAPKTGEDGRELCNCSNRAPAGLSTRLLV